MHRFSIEVNYMIRFDVLKVDLKKLVFSLFLTLGAGILSSVFTGDVQSVYQTLNKPFYLPPQLFPIVWTILYILMGISFYLFWNAEGGDKEKGYRYFFIQLFLNFFWTIIFFGFRRFGFAVIWILLMIVFICLTILEFYKVDKKAAYLLIPYLLWTLFATYLTVYIWLAH